MVHACKFVDEEVAEDIVHDVFVAYWEQHHMIVSSRLAAFLFKATQNSCLNYLKHQKVVENYREQWQLAIDRCEYYNQKIESTVSMSETNEELNYKLLEIASQTCGSFKLILLRREVTKGHSQSDACVLTYGTDTPCPSHRGIAQVLEACRNLDCSNVELYITVIWI